MAFIGAMMTAYKLRYANRVQFACAIDEDDIPSQDAAARLAHEMPLIVSCEPAPLSIGTKWNRLCALLRDCDVICLMTERMIPISNFWDAGIAATLENISDRPFYWSSPIDEGFAAPALPKRWLAGTDFSPLTERFHFWFTDTWLSEIHALVFGFPLAFTPTAFAGERKTTMACRDIAFWAEYYQFLQPQRFAEAQQMCEFLGYVWAPPTDKVMLKINHRMQNLIDNAKKMEAVVGDPSPPSERYLTMYHAAHAEMEASRVRAA